MKEPDKNPVNLSRRRFLVNLTSLVGAIGAAFAAIPFLSSWWPSARAQAAGAPVTVDLGNMMDGEQMTIEWRGKPVWIIKRSSDDLIRLRKIEDKLRDPASEVNEQQPTYVDKNMRSINPNYLVLIGICTHLGCSPVYRPYLNTLGDDWPGGFYCPCHGSTFDLAGRVFKGVPAPINLEVPPYKFINDHTIVIGVDQNTGKSA